MSFIVIVVPSLEANDAAAMRVPGAGVSSNAGTTRA
jgi:hypothetical protein